MTEMPILVTAQPEYEEVVKIEFVDAPKGKRRKQRVRRTVIVRTRPGGARVRWKWPQEPKLYRTRSDALHRKGA